MPFVIAKTWHELVALFRVTSWIDSLFSETPSTKSHETSLRRSAKPFTRHCTVYVSGPEERRPGPVIQAHLSYVSAFSAKSFQTFWAHESGDGCFYRCGTRRILWPAGSVRCWQDHDLANHCRIGIARHGAGRLRRPRPYLCTAGTSRLRYGLPKLRAVSALERI